MKTLYIVFAFFLGLTLLSCEDEYEPVNDFSDLVWMSNLRQNTSKVAINRYFSFSDLSQGTVKHFWSVSDTSGILYLEGNINRQDNDYLQFAKENQELETTDKTVHLLFTKPGMQGIRLYNEFKEQVTLKGSDTISSMFNSEKNVWVMDTTFMVEVFDSIQPAIQVFYKNKLIVDLPANETINLMDSANWTVQTIKAGEELKFVDNTVLGKPSERTWKFQGGVSDKPQDSESIAKYYRLGEYKTSVTLVRGGQNIPAASKTTYLPLIVKVVKSDLDFQLAEVPKEIEDQTIQIALNGEINAFTGEEGNFTVLVTNDASGLVDKAFTVATARINKTMRNVIDLKLKEPIYNTDKIKVSWSGGKIMSLDERVLKPFADQDVAMHIVNLCADKDVYSFEDGVYGDQKHWNVGWGNKGTASVTDKVAAHGKYSLKLEAGGNDDKAWAWVASPKADLPLIKGKTYKFSYEYNVPTANTVPTTNSWYGLLPWGGLISGSQEMAVKDEWVLFSNTFEYTSDDKARDILLRFGNDGSTTAAHAYFDNFNLIEVEVRPTAK